MHSRTCHLDTSGKHTLVHFQAIVSGSAKGRNERRMDIDDTIAIFLYHDLRDHDQKSGEYDQIHVRAVSQEQLDWWQSVGVEVVQGIPGLPEGQ